MCRLWKSEHEDPVSESKKPGTENNPNRNNFRFFYYALSHYYYKNLLKNFSEDLLAFFFGSRVSISMKGAHYEKDWKANRVFSRVHIVRDDDIRFRNGFRTVSRKKLRKLKYEGWEMMRSLPNSNRKKKFWWTVTFSDNFVCTHISLSRVGLVNILITGASIGQRQHQRTFLGINYLGPWIRTICVRCDEEMRSGAV